MNVSNRYLVNKLAIALVLKLVILMALWWVFVRDQGVAVDDNVVAAQLLQPALASTQGTNK
jgi:hypothetical protein